MTSNAARCERLSLSTETKRRLWAESGGYCQRPGCGVFLFDEGDVDFAQMAHIVAATTGGARDMPKAVIDEQGRAHHSNIAVLCANCHTVVDKDPGRHPIETMHLWKARSQELHERAHGTPLFADRAKARNYVEPLLAENHLAFETYGPQDDNFSTERADLWRHHVVRVVVPNNAKIARCLAVNRLLLTPAEQDLADRFELHQQEFAARHILDDHATGTTTFPDGMDEILTP